MQSRDRRCCAATGERSLVPEGHQRKLAGGKSAPAEAAPGDVAEMPMPRSGIEEIFRLPSSRRVCKWVTYKRRRGAKSHSLLSNYRNLLSPATPAPDRRSSRLSPMPLRGMVLAHRQPGAAFAGANLPPANFRRRPSGTGSGKSSRRRAMPDATARSHKRLVTACRSSRRPLATSAN